VASLSLAPCPLTRARTGGSVCRWAAKNSVPLTESTMHIRTPAGGTAVASTVTRAGPITNVISSMTDSRAKAA
jgi:hypothetical protein